MSTVVTTDKVEIKNEFTQRKKELQFQLDHLERFITDLQSHKISLENANRNLEQMAMQETDPVKRSKLYAAIRTNIELLMKIFNSISEIENVKHRYHKEIDEVMINKFRVIDIEIRKIEEKMNSGGENLTDFFEKLGNALTNLSRGQTGSIKTNLDKDPEYKL